MEQPSCACDEPHRDRARGRESRSRPHRCPWDGRSAHPCATAPPARTASRGLVALGCWPGDRGITHDESAAPGVDRRRRGLRRLRSKVSGTLGTILRLLPQTRPRGHRHPRPLPSHRRRAHRHDNSGDAAVVHTARDHGRSPARRPHHRGVPHRRPLRRHATRHHPHLHRGGQLSGVTGTPAQGCSVGPVRIRPVHRHRRHLRTAIGHRPGPHPLSSPPPWTRHRWPPRHSGVSTARPRGCPGTLHHPRGRHGLTWIRSPGASLADGATDHGRGTPRCPRHGGHRHLRPAGRFRARRSRPPSPGDWFHPRRHRLRPRGASFGPHPLSARPVDVA